MAKVTENDLKELKDLIIGNHQVLENRLTNIETRLTGVETRLTSVETQLTNVDTRLISVETHLTNVDTRLTSIEKVQTEVKEQLIGVDKQLVMVDTRLETWKPAIDKIPDLAEKVGELKNWRQFVIISITATISGVLGWFLRGGNTKP
ncbi:hypothetical protein [Crocosphaera chwakensis]|uniref:Uncharacterized protein n=1 Tax=Crocosphaera chwakensis CCY0110 TaxID=391612 RepID=A3IXP5_9CHRO|nr:hypothetical protein [Crocosphaera chwakensis]EAZ88746.1 hypothetical protein CY0110_27874 [Crocosphaera chwakensis CCY0110]